MTKTGFASCGWGILTRAEGVHVLVELEAHHWAIVVNDVGLAVPGTRHHLLSAVSLHTNTGKWETCILLIMNTEIQQLCSYYLTTLLQSYSVRHSVWDCDQ